MLRETMNRLTVVAIAATATVATAVPASAALVKPTGVSATSYYATGQHHTNLIDGSGLTAESAAATHDTGSGTLWHGRLGGWGGGSSGAPVVNNQAAIFDLGGVFDLTNAYIWNMNQGSSLGAARSINQYDLDVSSDGVNWTTVVVDGNLAVAPGTGNVAANNIVFGSTQTGVRYVRIGADSAHSGLASEYVGLSEVRFEGTQTAAGPTPTATYAANTGLLPQSVSAADLLQGIAASSSPAPAGGTVAQLTDGIGAPNGNATDFPNRVFATDNAAATWQLHYSLTDISDISKINVFSFNTDARRDLDFDVEYSTDDGVTYQYLAIGASNLGTFSGSGNTSVVSLEQVGGKVAHLATDLRFTFRPINGLTSSLVEIDAVGVGIGPGQAVALQNATATASQSGTFNLPVGQAIDGNKISGGWGNGPSGGSFSNNVAVFETVNDLGGYSEAVLHFTMDFASFADHGIGRFRLLATTADRSEFADGLANGGDVDFTGLDTGTWFVLDDLIRFRSTSGLDLAGGVLQGDGSFLIDDTLDPASDRYDIWLRTTVSGITGFRLEILKDLSLDGGGPGLSDGNGNSVLTEFSVSIVAIPTPAALPAGLALLTLVASRRRRHPRN